MKQKARGRLGLLSSEALSGAGGSISNMAHPNNCWLEASAPYHLDLNKMVTTCPSARDSRENNKMEAPTLVMT